MITDILLIIIASLWTIIMLVNFYVNLSHWSKYYLPLEATGKILNTLANALLLICIWLNIIIGKPFIGYSWVLIAVAFIMILVTFKINSIQIKYTKEKIERLKKEFDKEIEGKIHSGIVKEKKRKTRRRRRKSIRW